MKILQRFLMGLGTVLLLALSLQLVAPKAVHAVVSTLVTVANTASNPIPVEQTKQATANFVTLLYNSDNAANQANPPWIQINPDGSREVFSLPAGQNFVITDLLWEVNCDGSQGGGPCATSSGTMVETELRTPSSFTGIFFNPPQTIGYISRASYATGILGLTAGAGESLRSGLVVSAMPVPYIYPYGRIGEYIDRYTIQGYLVTAPPAN
jgi:hypothetical protein